MKLLERNPAQATTDFLQEELDELLDNMDIKTALLLTALEEISDPPLNDSYPDIHGCILL